MTNPGNSPVNGEADINAVMLEIRKEVARRRREGMSLATENWPEPPHIRRNDAGFVDDKPIRSALSLAEGNADAGLHIPPMVRFRGIVRKLAALTARVVVYLSSFITERQRMFNQALVSAGRLTTDALNILDAELASVRGELTSVRGGLSSLEAQIREHDSLFSKVHQTLDYLKAGVGQLDRRVGTLTTHAPQVPLIDPRGSETASARRVSYDEYQALYLYFEERFRGSREDIKQRQRDYLDVLKEAGAGLTDRPVVDVGCGRGEWLELLMEEHMLARGVDTNALVVERCRQQGLDVTVGDAIAYLHDIPDGSLGAVTGFHIIEHLPPDTLVELLDETMRVLRFGGVVIFETPNPLNILVGACNFYIDPTHRRPLHPDFMAFLMESRGFARVERRFLHPFGKEYLVEDEDSPVAKRFNEYFYGPRDYAIIGYKREETRSPLSSG